MRAYIASSVYCLIAILIFAIPHLQLAANLTPCNSFPKIFGGGTGNSLVHQIDVFDDYLASGGGTKDPSLTSSTFNVPFMILSSISMNFYYWTKAFVQI